MVLLSLPAGLQGASPRICALGLWSYTAMARPMSFFPASSFADRAARYSRAASRTLHPCLHRTPCPMIGPGLCRARRLTLRLSSCGPPSCWPLRDCKARTPSTRWEPWSYNAFSRHKAPSSLLRGCRSSPGPWQRGPGHMLATSCEGFQSLRKTRACVYT
jgi:hypothetical protein